MTDIINMLFKIRSCDIVISAFKLPVKRSLPPWLIRERHENYSPQVTKHYPVAQTLSKKMWLYSSLVHRFSRRYARCLSVTPSQRNSITSRYTLFTSFLLRYRNFSNKIGSGKTRPFKRITQFLRTRFHSKCDLYLKNNAVIFWGMRYLIVSLFWTFSNELFHGGFCAFEQFNRGLGGICLLLLATFW